MNIFSSKSFIFSVFGFCFLLIGSELLLRHGYGFADAVLYRKDNDYEYIPIPQTRTRFGNKVNYNSYFQRNREIKAQDSVIILGFGDSVLNGGVLVDQDSLVTNRLTSYLSEKHKINVLFTNISAGSWGPDNCFAYLKKHGDFGANGMLLVVSSHDAYDNMSFDILVGTHKSYPKTQYKLALIEIFDRYLIPRYLTPHFKKEKVQTSKFDKLGINKRKTGEKFNSGFKDFKHYTDSTGIPLLVYLHPEKKELERGKYNKQGQEIIEFCEKNNIPLIKALELGINMEGYLDFIHLNEKGHQQMFEIIKNYF